MFGFDVVNAKSSQTFSMMVFRMKMVEKSNIRNFIGVHVVNLSIIFGFRHIINYFCRCNLCFDLDIKWKCELLHGLIIRRIIPDVITNDIWVEGIFVKYF